MRVIILLIALSIALLVAAFAMLNAQVVQLNYILGEVSIPLVAIILVAFALGAMLAGFVFSGSLFRHSIANRRLKSQLAKCNESHKGMTNY
ncbi:MAG: hypothetical protein CMF48_07015 [Legionellales bacterium]|nr:hypothetical protein [Legionellales bacterium]